MRIELQKVFISERGKKLDREERIASGLLMHEPREWPGSYTVVAEAIDVIESGKPKTLEFGVADETAWKVGLSCGGTIRVYVEKID